MLLKNENKLVDMISIMKSLHKYVPTTCTEQEVTLSTGQKDVAENYKFHQIQFGGDQLTCARVRGSQTVKKMTNIVYLVWLEWQKIGMLKYACWRCICKHVTFLSLL